MRRCMKLSAALLGCMGVFLASAGTTNAFLQRTTGQLDNAITPGSIKVAVAEPHWKEADAKDLVPGQSVVKDPAVTNTGDNPSWAFLRVDVPVRRIAVVDLETKRKTERTDLELFTFQADSAWVLVDKQTDSGAAHYVYGYRNILRPGESTSALFREVALVDYLEGEIGPGESLQMPIEAASIQSHVEGTDPRTVYQEYLAQEAADGKE